MAPSAVGRFWVRTTVRGRHRHADRRRAQAPDIAKRGTRSGYFSLPARHRRAGFPRVGTEGNLVHPQDGRIHPRPRPVRRAVRGHRLRVNEGTEGGAFPYGDAHSEYYDPPEDPEERSDRDASGKSVEYLGEFVRGIL